MQEALPYKTWLLMPSKDNPLTNTMSTKSSGHVTSSSSSIYYLGEDPKAMDLKNTVKENAIILIGNRGCCMSHVVKRLLQGLGVNPPVYEVDEEDENDVIDDLQRIAAAGGGGGGGGGDGEEGGHVRVQLPVVFIGGQLFGGLDRVMATHITGELTPILKKAGALWL